MKKEKAKREQELADTAEQMGVVRSHTETHCPLSMLFSQRAVPMFGGALDWSELSCVAGLSCISWSTDQNSIGTFR